VKNYPGGLTIMQKEHQAASSGVKAWAGGVGALNAKEARMHARTVQYLDCSYEDFKPYMLSDCLACALNDDNGKAVEVKVAEDEGYSNVPRTVSFPEPFGKVQCTQVRGRAKEEQRKEASKARTEKAESAEKAEREEGASAREERTSARREGASEASAEKERAKERKNGASAKRARAPKEGSC
jgi:hypothetical protein